MNKILTLVGYEGITEGHSYAVNNMPYVHDQLLASVSYSDELAAYFDRKKSSALDLFKAEIITQLSKNAKFSDTLLRFPEGRIKKDEQITALSGQNIEQVYDLKKVVQYGIFEPKGMILYMVGNYRLRVSLYFGHSDLKRTDPIYAQIFEKADADEDYLSYIQIDLEAHPDYASKINVPINSKISDQLVIVIECLEDCTFFTQEFITIEPTISNTNTEFDVSGGFSSGFSDGFSIGRGAVLGTVNPIISLVKASIIFDIDAFVSDNARRLALYFALRVAVHLMNDKRIGKKLNILTNQDREEVAAQVMEIEAYIEKQLKVTCSSLLFNVQSTSTPPIELNGKVGYEMGSFVSAPDYGYSDEGAYPGFSIP